MKPVEADAPLSRCVSIDLETEPNSGRILSFAAIRQVTTDTCDYRKGDLAAALRRLDEYAAGVEFVLGHNVIEHDLPYLREASSGLRLLTKPPIDTLWLNPLAFPRNPYHRLVKHYKDGRLQAGRASDPELDAGLVFAVLRNQLTELPKTRSRRSRSSDGPPLARDIGREATGFRGGLPIGKGCAEAEQTSGTTWDPGRSSQAEPAPTRLSSRSWRRSAPAGRWPTRSPGSRWPARTPSCLPGSATGFPRRAHSSEGSATRPAPIPRATGAALVAIQRSFSTTGSGSRDSGRSLPARTDVPCRRPSSHRRSPSPRSSESSRPAPASRSATSCRRWPSISGPARSPWSSHHSWRSWPIRSPV